MRRAPLAMLAMVGCDQLFKLDTVEPRDAPATPGDVLSDDANVDTSPDAATFCADPNADLVLPLIADTWLGSPAQGNNELLFGGGQARIMVKFDTLGYDLSQVTLLLDKANFSIECDPDGTNLCTSCTGADGLYTVSLTRTDWSETTATSTTRDGINPWGAVNATGPQDRADSMTEPFSGVAFSHTRAFAPGARPFQGQQISFQIEPFSASRVFFSKESVGCNNDNAIAPRLFARCR